MDKATVTIVCPVCEEPVEQEGFFCSYGDWLHWHLVNQDVPLIHLNNYVDLQSQPWYDRLLGITKR